MDEQQSRDELANILEENYRAFRGMDAADEIERLRGEVARLTEIVEGGAREVILQEMHFEKGAMDVYIRHPLFALFATSIGKIFIEMGAQNYLEMRLYADPIGFVTVTAQRENGKTPHELRIAVEEKNTRLQTAITQIGHEVTAMDCRNKQKMRIALANIIKLVENVLKDENAVGEG